MSHWYVGQKVVCIKVGPWIMEFRDGSKSIFSGDGPKYGDVVTVAGPGNDEGFIALKEYENCGIHNSWNDARFRPIDPLTEQIERIEKEGAPVEPELIEA